jgi:hypothetical protein
MALHAEEGIGGARQGRHSDCDVERFHGWL